MHDMKRPTITLAIAALAIGVTGTACGDTPDPPATVSITQPPTTAAPTDPAEPVPATDKTNRVSALDDSAVYSLRAGELVRLDPKTFAVLSSWPREKGMVSIRAVAPGGRWVALTDHRNDYDVADDRSHTQLTVFDAEAGAWAGAATYHLALKGDVRPEAFSVSGGVVFALDHRGDFYRVQTITLATGERKDTLNRDKTLYEEDMRGTAFGAVLSADRTLLATLYRNPGDEDEPAFVHVLDLVHTWAYCADLPAPFGSGAPGSDQIELTPAGTVVVTNIAASRRAEIHIDEVRTPGAVPVTVEYTNAAPNAT
jgi:hypothetical protein